MRRLLRFYLGRRFFVVGAAGAFGAAGSGGTAAAAAAGGRHYDFDATAEEIDAEDPQLGR